MLAIASPQQPNARDPLVELKPPITLLKLIDRYVRGFPCADMPFLTESTRYFHLPRTKRVNRPSPNLRTAAAVDANSSRTLLFARTG